MRWLLLGLAAAYFLLAAALYVFYLGWWWRGFALATWDAALILVRLKRRNFTGRASWRWSR